MSFPQDGRTNDEDRPGPLHGHERRHIRTATRDKLLAQEDHDSASHALPGTSVPRRNVVFADPVALRHLEDEPYVNPVDSKGVLHGYELYLVEQWACSRKSPTVLVVTHTGNERDVITVGVLAVPLDENLWSAKLQVYFKAAEQYSARPKETELGHLMITNLSSFPSTLTIISIPDGDVRKHRQAFFVNEDLKRLGCYGRSGLSLADPTEATQAKFHQLFKTSDRIPFAQSVTELVKLCQIALYMFEKLKKEYIDGLLCDVTEAAVASWWNEVGIEHYNFEPADGILGPSTISALLGMLLGARNRLNWHGAPVPKDAFDIEAMKRGISYFQKAQKLETTRRLDRQTLFRLHTATAKAAAGEGWGVQKAVKSTMTEIGGKKGEIVMDMVSGRDKGGLADIETVDIDRFIKLLYGDRLKWLWLGKARRNPVDHVNPDLDSYNSIPTKNESARRTWSHPVDDNNGSKLSDEPFGQEATVVNSNQRNFDHYAERDGTRRAVFRSVAGKMSDARSGLGRIKGAVGGTRRAHGSKGSVSAREPFMDSHGPYEYSDAIRENGVVTGPAAVGRAFTWKNKPEEYLAAMRHGDYDISQEVFDSSHDPQSSTSILSSGKGDGQDRASTAIDEKRFQGTQTRENVISRAPSVSRSVTGEVDLEGPASAAGEKDQRSTSLISRRRSCSAIADTIVVNENKWARRLSFSDAEEAVLGWDELVDITGVSAELQEVAVQVEMYAQLREAAENTAAGIKHWANDKIKAVGVLDVQYGKDVRDLQQLYQQLNEACQEMRNSSQEVLAEERVGLTESVKGIEVLVARLEYEISGLAARVQDVEDGIQNFERQVGDVEHRAEELKTQLETESWPHWFVRTLTGIGTGPNITRTD